jgi:small subunit ribosomal protein S20
LARVQPELSRGVARGVLHKNTASRKLSRLTRRLVALG